MMRTVTGHAGAPSDAANTELSTEPIHPTLVRAKTTTGEHRHGLIGAPLQFTTGRQGDISGIFLHGGNIHPHRRERLPPRATVAALPPTVLS